MAPPGVFVLPVIRSAGRRRIIPPELATHAQICPTWR